MDEESIKWLSKIMNGGGATAIAAVAGRLMWHAGLVRKGNRKFFGKELLWEMPIAFGMGLIGVGFSEYMGFTGNVEIGVMTGLAYLGPRGIEVLLDRWVNHGK